LHLLQVYHWPGNVRELQNVIERAIILCDSETLSIRESFLHAETPDNRVPLHQALVERERQMIEAALEGSRGRVSGPCGAAVKLGIPSTTLQSKIQRLRIDKYKFKSEARASGAANCTTFARMAELSPLIGRLPR
jgi:formate hydrogenlyase transcriptional activator